MQFSTLTSSIWQTISSSTASLHDLLVPPTCLTCDAYVAEQGGCCATCWRELRFITKPLCPVMGVPFPLDLGDGFLSAEAISAPPPFERLRAVMLYDRLARSMISSFKYADRTDLGRWLGKWMSVFGRDLLLDADVIVPVPLHRKRLRKRRYNQSAELARHISEDAATQYMCDVLLRRKDTRQQVGLSETERERNVTGAFLVPESRKIDINGRRVVLVDDVYTTGATVRAATRALLRGGVAAVDVLVFAKVDTHLIDSRQLETDTSS